MIGAFYLTEKEGRPEFDDGDERLIVLLAAHAAITIENARLYERSRELSIVEERNRLARELHDSVSQKLFGLVLTAESAGTLVDADPAEARAELERLRGLAQEAQEELRSLVFELRPPALESEGLGEALRKHVDVLRRVYRQEIALELAGAPRRAPTLEREVFRIAQEALQNALRHAEANELRLRLAATDGRVELTVSDDGVGFDPTAPAVRSRRLGLTSMEERARGSWWDADDRVGRPAAGRPSASRWRSDPRSDRRRPCGRAPGAADVPRAPGRDRGRRRGRGRRGGAAPRRSGSTPTSSSSTS